jgi:hypothetical protein
MKSIFFFIPFEALCAIVKCPNLTDVLSYIDDIILVSTNFHFIATLMIHESIFTHLCHDYIFILNHATNNFVVHNYLDLNILTFSSAMTLQCNHFLP